MNTKNRFNWNFSLLVIIILSMKFSLIFSVTKFTYPSAVTLKNGNILVIHKTGVTICNLSYTNFDDIINFSESEQISSEEDLSKITLSQFADGFTVAVVINNIYIFDENGEFKSKSDNIFEPFPLEDFYYTLALQKKYNNSYYYILGAIIDNSMDLLYYEYNSIKNTTSILNRKSGYKDIYNENNLYQEFNITNKGISCQFMNSDTDETLLCVYLVVNSSDISYLTSNFMHINDNNSIEPKFGNVHFGWNNFTIIKSSIGENPSIVLFCYYDSNNPDITPRCFALSFINNGIGIYSHIAYPYKCKNNYFSFKVNYISESEEIVYSCLTDYRGIQLGFYNKSIEYKYFIYKYSECEKVYSYSLLYLNYSKEYYFLSDLMCQGTPIPYVKFFNEPAEEKSEKEEEEEEEEEEEMEEREEE